MDSGKVLIRFTRKRIIGILLIVILVEVYAQSYANPRPVFAVTREEALKIYNPSGPFVGEYNFTASNCDWLVKYNIERPTSYHSCGWIRIFKVSENTSPLASPTNILVSGFQYNYPGHLYCSLNMNEGIYYGNDSVYIRIDMYCGQDGSYPLNLELKLNLYQRTLIALIPTGESIVTINETIVTSIYY